MRIYTDASTRTAQGISGLGFVATDARDKELFRKATVVHESDNNTAELRAICFALASIKDRKQHVTLFTDSTYAINAIRNNKYRPSEEKLLKTIYIHLNRLNCSLFWLKGHCQDGTVLSHYNKIADKISKNVRKQYEIQIKLNKKAYAQNRLLQSLKNKKSR